MRGRAGGRKGGGLMKGRGVGKGKDDKKHLKRRKGNIMVTHSTKISRKP
jgi:hypothetical protein